MWLRPLLRLLALIRCSEIDWGRYIEDQLPLLSYNFETAAVSNVVTTRATKRRNMGELVVLATSGRELDWLQLAFYESVQSCGLK